jgi:hypothetical protein
MPKPVIWKSIALVAGFALFLLGVGWLQKWSAEKTRDEIEGYCAMNPTSVWVEDPHDFSVQHSVNCKEWNRQADEADAYCIAHHDGVWESPPSETHRLVNCREWLQDN